MTPSSRDDAVIPESRRLIRDPGPVRRTLGPLARDPGSARFAMSANAEPRTDISVAAPWEIASADPAVSGFAFLRLETMETLVDADAEGRLPPGLAESWTVSEDGLVWRFSLRSDASFHDGSVLTAEIAAAAIQRAFDNPGPLENAPIAGCAVEGGDVVASRLLQARLVALIVGAASFAMMQAPPGDAARRARSGSFERRRADGRARRPSPRSRVRPQLARRRTHRARRAERIGQDVASRRSGGPPAP